MTAGGGAEDSIGKPPLCHVVVLPRAAAFDAGFIVPPIGFTDDHVPWHYKPGALAQLAMPLAAE